MHLYVPWWGDNKALGFPRGYHIELGGGFGMPGYGFGGGIQNYPQSRGGGYGAELKDEYRRYYGAFVSFVGPRRAGGARRLLLRDRSERRRQVGHSGAALPPHVERSRAAAGEAHAGDLPRASSREMGGVPTSPMPTDGAELRAGGRRPDHPRGRRDAHGQRPEDVGAQQATARRTTPRTCSSPTAARSSRRPTRT